MARRGRRPLSGGNVCVAYAHSAYDMHKPKLRYTVLYEHIYDTSDQRCRRRKVDLAEKRERLRPWWRSVKVLPRARERGKNTYRGFQTRGPATCAPAHCLPHLNLRSLKQRNLLRPTREERYGKWSRVARLSGESDYARDYGNGDHNYRHERRGC